MTLLRLDRVLVPENLTGEIQVTNYVNIRSGSLYPKQLVQATHPENYYNSLLKLIRKICSFIVSLIFILLLVRLLFFTSLFCLLIVTLSFVFLLTINKGAA